MTTTNIWQGTLVRLRTVEPEDWDKFFAWEADTDLARLTDNLIFPVSREVAKHWAAEAARTEPWRSTHEFRCIIDNLQGDFVGTINTHACNPRVGTFHYGLHIQPEHRRKGYATEAIQLILRYFFRELRYQKVNVSVYAFNVASLRLHHKLGFQEEGRLRRTVFTDGAYSDEILSGMTVEEFEASQREDRG